MGRRGAGNFSRDWKDSRIGTEAIFLARLFQFEIVYGTWDASSVLEIGTG